MTAAAPARADLRAQLYAEREQIERRQYTDLLRLDQIRAELVDLADEPRD